MLHVLQENRIVGDCKEALQQPSCAAGFTLMELSIVLVIIGLVIGAIMVGKDLIQAGMVRAQVTQLQSYTTAINAFKEKYGFLPGDIPASRASSVGLTSIRYCSDGDGVFKGNTGDPSYCTVGNNGMTGYGQQEEPLLFWSDLSESKLISETLTGFRAYTTTSPNISATPLNKLFPSAKSGNGAIVYVWSGGPSLRYDDTNNDGYSYMSISIATVPSQINGNPSMTAATAYGIDVKIDDGAPQTGRIQAFHLGTGTGGYTNDFTIPYWADGAQLGGGHATTSVGNAATTNATPLLSSTCYDNGGTNGAAQRYSVGNTGINCAISMRLN